jgi:hypothetical protein
MHQRSNDVNTAGLQLPPPRPLTEQYDQHFPSHSPITPKQQQQSAKQPNGQPTLHLRLRQPVYQPDHLRQPEQRPLLNGQPQLRQLKQSIECARQRQRQLLRPVQLIRPPRRRHTPPPPPPVLPEHELRLRSQSQPLLQPESKQQRWVIEQLAIENQLNQLQLTITFGNWHYSGSE